MMFGYTHTGAWFAQTGALAVVIFLGILLAIDAGRRLGKYVHKVSKGAKTAVDDTLVGAILGLMALVLAFTFSGAAGRLDQRERLVAAETFAIENAYHTIDYLDAADQVLLRKLFSQLIQERRTLYENVYDFEKFAQDQVQIRSTLQKIQQAAYTASSRLPADQRFISIRFINLVGAVIQAFDSQLEAAIFHPPRVILLSLFVLVLIGSFITGYKMGIALRRDRLLSLMFASLISCAIYLILSLEFPLLFGSERLESNVRQVERLNTLLIEPVKGP